MVYDKELDRLQIMLCPLGMSIFFSTMRSIEALIMKIHFPWLRSGIDVQQHIKYDNGFGCKKTLQYSSLQ